MSFLNQSSQCYNGNDIYSSNKKEISGIGVLEFDDIFEDLDFQKFKKSQNKFEKNTSLYIASKKNTDNDPMQLNKEKARTETIQSSFNNINENYLSSNNIKKYGSFYNNQNKGPVIEEPILNPFQKKDNNLVQKANVPKLNIENIKENQNNLENNHKSLIKGIEEKNYDIEPSQIKFEENLNKSNNFYTPHSFIDESQNIVNIIWLIILKN